MNTNRNIPYNYNVKDIDWPGLKAVGISKEQLEADGNLDLLLQGIRNHPVETLYPGNQPDHGRHIQTGTR